MVMFLTEAGMNTIVSKLEPVLNRLENDFQHLQAAWNSPEEISPITTLLREYLENGICSLGIRGATS